MVDSSAARVQSCLACGVSVYNPIVHCSFFLPILVDAARGFFSLPLRTLCSSLCLDALVVVAAWATDIHMFVYDFWSGRMLERSHVSLNQKLGGILLLRGL